MVGIGIVNQNQELGVFILKVMFCLMRMIRV